MEPPTPQEAIERRLIALEEWMMHAEELIKQLNEVTCTVQDRLDRQDRAIERLGQALGQMAEGEPEKRSLEEERPPHY